MPNIDQVQLPDGSQYNLKDNISGYVTAGYVDDAIDGLTKADVGLGNVDNTSDLNKPVSTAQQIALNGKTDTTVIAPTEATTTASRRYEISEQFILNGVLYTATAVIASGDTIIVNTNCALSESITEQIDEVNAKTSGLTRMTKLWENPALTASFSAQTVTLASDDYDFLLWIHSESGSVICPKGKNALLNRSTISSGSYTTTIERNCVYVSDTEYSIAGAYVQNSNSTRSNNNAYMIPLAVYGIKII